jgi:hypothetical protein
MQIDILWLTPVPLLARLDVCLFFEQKIEQGMQSAFRVDAI